MPNQLEVFKWYVDTYHKGLFGNLQLNVKNGEILTVNENKVKTMKELTRLYEEAHKENVTK